jgi:hypothetical protein
MSVEPHLDKPRSCLVFFLILGGRYLTYFWRRSSREAIGARHRGTLPGLE